MRAAGPLTAHRRAGGGGRFSAVTPLRPRAVLTVGVVALAAQLPAAAPALAADTAATVNGVEITVEQFDDLVTSLSSTPGFEQFAPSAQSQTLDGDSGRSILGLLVGNELQRQFLDGVGAPVPDADDVAAWQATVDPTQPTAQLTGAALDAVGQNTLLMAALQALPVDDAATLRERYERAPSSLGVYCVTAVLSDDRDTAEDIADELRDGGDVEVVATATEATVSDWSCAPLASVGDAGLLETLLVAEPGDIVGPIVAGGRFAVLVVDPVAVAVDKLDAFYQRLAVGGGATSPGFVTYQGFALRSEVTIAARYGRWDVASSTVVPLGA